MNETIQSSAGTSPFIRGVQALADWLNVSEVTVRRAMRRHTLPFVRLGGAILFRKADVEKAIDRLTVPSIGMAKSRKEA